MIVKVNKKMKNKLAIDVMFWVEIWRWAMCQLRQRDQVGSKGQQHENKKMFETFNLTLGLERINEWPRVRLNNLNELNDIVA